MRILTACLAMLVLAVPQAAAARDRDHDGLPDRWERKNHLSTSKKSSNADTDRDGVDNRNEMREGTRARNPDSDGDGIGDGQEDRDRDGLSNAGEDLTGNDPRLSDSDEDGVPDGEELTGIVTSLEGKALTITLATGGTLQALVTSETALECETEGSLEAGYSPGRRVRSRRRGRHGRHRGHARRAVAAQFEEELLEEEEEGDEEVLEDEEEEYLEDESLDEEDEAGSDSCPAGALAPGARVHDAELFWSEAGLEFDSLGLVR